MASETPPKQTSAMRSSFSRKNDLRSVAAPTPAHSNARFAGDLTRYRMAAQCGTPRLTPHRIPFHCFIPRQRQEQKQARFRTTTRLMEEGMPQSVYKIIELVGTSPESWEKAAKAAIDRASKTLRDLRIAEVAELDIQLKDGKFEAYRAKLKVSFKFEGSD